MKKQDKVIDFIRAKLQAGELKPGDKLPSGVDLARELDVAHLTVRRAFRELELCGEVKIIHGCGTFVAEETAEKRRVLIIRDDNNLSMANPSNYYLPAFLCRCHELEIEAEEVLLSFLRNSPVRHVVEQLREKKYSGVLLTSSHYRGGEPELEILNKLNIPVIIPRGAIRDAGITGFTALRSNTPQAWADGLAYLAEKGMTRVALLLCEDPLDKGISRDMTMDSHRDLLRRCGMDDDEEMITLFHDFGAPRKEAIIIRIKELLQLPEPPQAFYCFSDFTALCVYQVLAEAGLSIPGDYAVMGFCGYPGGKLLNPPLATVDCDYGTIGKYAAEMLCDSDKWFEPLTANKKGTEVIIKHKVKRRASVESWKNQQTTY